MPLPVVTRVFLALGEAQAGTAGCWRAARGRALACAGPAPAALACGWDTALLGLPLVGAW